MRRVIIFTDDAGGSGEAVPPSAAGPAPVAQASVQAPDAQARGAKTKSCRKAVEGAYWSMIYLGCSHFRAFRVADRVFRWHRPMASDFDRETRLRCWIDGESLQ
jgi:hypothetical protein